MAVAHAAAAQKGVPLYRSLADRQQYVLPVPMLNILNGGQHADNNVDIQEFMILPLGLGTFGDALRAATETFHTLKGILAAKGYGTATGDEGGFAPSLKSNEEPMELLVEAIEKAGYEPGDEIAIAMDPAASEFYEDGAYVFSQSDGSRKTAAELGEMWSRWIDRYPLVSLEDGFLRDRPRGLEDGRRQAERPYSARG